MASPFAALAARLAICSEGTLKRNLALDRSIAAARTLWPSARIGPSGSFANGTSLRGSDIDVVVDIPLEKYTQNAARRWARELECELHRQRIAAPGDMAVIGQARVPIVTYMDKKYRIGVDISFLSNGLVNTEYVKQELDSRPYMRTMVILLKYWLKSRGYNKVYTGGLSSYGLALTVIGYFNVRKTIKARKCTPEQYKQWIIEQDLYHLIIDYLTFWSCQWKLASTMLEPGEGIIYKKGAKGHCGKKGNSLLCIADPTDPENDVTNGTRHIYKLRQAMKMLRDKMKATPGIDEAQLQELLRTTGSPFFAGRKEKSEKKKRLDKDKKDRKKKEYRKNKKGENIGKVGKVQKVEKVKEAEIKDVKEVKEVKKHENEGRVENAKENKAPKYKEPRLKGTGTREHGSREMGFSKDQRPGSKGFRTMGVGPKISRTHKLKSKRPEKN